ncbi:MAG: alpha/beta fold hydrolase [Deltaproteobacteria bacterium]|nr:alpha/beta fold hydrolase [Nannocystaceae bacterium]
MDEGAGPVLLAVHGLPGTHRDFRWLASALAGRVRLVRLDMPGFGATTIRETPRKWPELAALVVAFARVVIGGPYAVLGHSFGGPMATEIAARDEQVNALVWLAPVGMRPHRALRHLPPFALIDNAARRRVLGPAVLRIYRLAMRAAGFPSSVTVAEVARCLELLSQFSFAAHRRAVASLRVPCFGAWTDDDALVEPEVVMELLAAARPGPRLRFADGGHNLQKTHASEIAEALVPFLHGLHASQART